MYVIMWMMIFQVEYKIGANLLMLPSELAPSLDDKLVPAIHSVMSSAQERVAVELIFQIVKIVWIFALFSIS